MSDCHSRRKADLSENNKFSNLANIDSNASEKSKLSSGVNCPPLEK
jgi:hypothetical protein